MQILFNIVTAIALKMLNVVLAVYTWNTFVAGGQIPNISFLNVIGLLIFLGFIKSYSNKDLWEFEKFTESAKEELTNLTTKTIVCRFIITLFLIFEIFVFSFFK